MGKKDEADDLRDLIKELKSATKAYNTAKNSFVTAGSTDIKDLTAALIDSKEQFADKKKETSDLQFQLDISESLLDIEKELADVIAKKEETHDHIKAILKDLEKSGDAEGKNLLARNQILEKQLELRFDELTAKKDLLANGGEILKQKIKELELEEKRQEFVEKYSEEIETQLGFLDSIDDAIKEIPVVGGVLSKALGLDNIKKELSEKMLGAFKAGLQGAEGAAGGLMAGLRGAADAAKGVLVSMGPLLPIMLAVAAAAALIFKALEMDEELVDLAKNLDVSKHTAHEIHLSAIDIASEMNQVGINSEQVVKVMEEMKTSMGYNVGLMAQHNEAARQLVETTTLLVEKQGLSTEEAVALNRAAIAVNLPMENVALMAAEMGDELVSGREIMQDLGNVSKGVLINFSKNPTALVKAVKQAKLLGTTLDDINNAGDNLLDIESSIQKEMEARVITGRNLNLNQARYYAMTGDTEKLQEEIVKQMGSAAEYEEMMPMQRKALAEAMGMNLEQMDSMMLKQKELETLGYSQLELSESLKLVGTDRAKAIAKLGSTEAKDLLAKKYAENDRVKTMEKLTNVMAKLGDLASKFLGPVLSIVDGLISGITFLLTPFERIASYINSIFTGSKSIMDVLIGMGPLWSGIAAFVTTIATIWVGTMLPAIASAVLGVTALAFDMGALAIEAAAAAIGAITTAIATTLGAAAIPIAAGLAVAVGAFTAYKSMNDGVIGPDGNMIVSGPEGSISLNKDDSIIAGTNLFGGLFGGESTGPAGPDPQMGEMIALLKQLVATTSGPTVIKIGSRTIEELDSQIGLRKNYNTVVDSSYGNRT